jgi:pyruvate/2-oxoglutarate/acetoin dehydrogenase E1 component
METLRDTIKRITSRHLAAGNHLFAQNIHGVGALCNTINVSDPNLVELQTSDVGNGGIVVGASLSQRPCYVIRFGGFVRLNLPFILSYAAKSKFLWGRPCPVWIRVMSCEGGVGPVASNSHHGYVYREPGINVVAPMTPKEYEDCYTLYMANSDPYYFSEHRNSYNNSLELPNKYHENNGKPKITLVALSITRFEAEKARIQLLESYDVAIIHVVYIKPCVFTIQDRLAMSQGNVFLFDDDYPEGILNDLAYKIIKITGNIHVKTLGLENRSAGFSKETDNVAPTFNKMLDFIRKSV